jgi:hypothetical protein
MATDVDEMLYQLLNGYCPFDHAGPFVECEHFTADGDDKIVRPPLAGVLDPNKEDT